MIQKPRHPRLVMISLLIAVAIVVVDQMTKWWILEIVMQPPRLIPVTPFFNLGLVWNRGVSFGLLSHDFDLMPLALTALALGICVALGIWMWRSDHRLIPPVAGIVIGGAIGNVIDRIRFGAVVDFLDFHAFGWHWPAFNVADSAIVIGVCILILDGLVRKPEKG